MSALATWAAKRGAVWLLGKQFSPEKRAVRKQRRLVRRKNRERKKAGLPLLVEEEIEMFGFRTSTVAGVVGMAVYGIMKAIAVLAPEFLAAVPVTEEFVAAALAYIAARVNKTPSQPGAV